MPPETNGHPPPPRAPPSEPSLAREFWVSCLLDPSSFMQCHSAAVGRPAPGRAVRAMVTRLWCLQPTALIGITISKSLQDVSNALTPSLHWKGAVAFCAFLATCLAIVLATRRRTMSPTTIPLTSIRFVQCCQSPQPDAIDHLLKNISTFFFDAEELKGTVTKTTHRHGGLARLRQELCHRRRVSTRLAPRLMLTGLHQRFSEGNSTRCPEHPRPPAFLQQNESTMLAPRALASALQRNSAASSLQPLLSRWPPPRRHRLEVRSSGHVASLSRWAGLVGSHANGTRPAVRLADLAPKRTRSSASCCQTHDDGIWATAKVLLDSQQTRQ